MRLPVRARRSLASSPSGNNPRAGRGPRSAPACPPAPASRAPSPPRACLPRRRPRATRCRTGPVRRWRPRHGTAGGRRSGRPTAPVPVTPRPVPRAIGAASHAIVTCGASSDRSQSIRSRSPASNWSRLTKPRASSQPSGDSARLTVTDRAGRRIAGPVVDAGMPSPPIARSCNSRGCLTLLIEIPSPRLRLNRCLATAAKL